MEVIAEAGMADIIITVFRALDGVPTNNDIKYRKPGIIINLVVTP